MCIHIIERHKEREKKRDDRWQEEIGRNKLRNGVRERGRWEKNDREDLFLSLSHLPFSFSLLSLHIIPSLSSSLYLPPQ